jgi:hypothetical protein
VLRIERIVARFTRDHDLDQIVSMLLVAIKGVGIAVVIIIGVNFRATKTGHRCEDGDLAAAMPRGTYSETLCSSFCERRTRSTE